MGVFKENRMQHLLSEAVDEFSMVIEKNTIRKEFLESQLLLLNNICSCVGSNEDWGCGDESASSAIRLSKLAGSLSLYGDKEWGFSIYLNISHKMEHIRDSLPILENLNEFFPAEGWSSEDDPDKFCRSFKNKVTLYHHDGERIAALYITYTVNLTQKDTCRVEVIGYKDTVEYSTAETKIRKPIMQMICDD
jgi:hypothetical protein